MGNTIDQIGQLLGLVVMIKVLPLLTGLLGNGQAGATSTTPIIPQAVSYEAPPVTAPIVQETTAPYIEQIRAGADIPGTNIGVTQAAWENALPYQPQEAPPAVVTVEPQLPAAPVYQPAPLPEIYAGGGVPPIQMREVTPAPTTGVSYQVGGQPTSGQYWVNPVTQQAIAPYIAGQTPASVTALRKQDIYPAIRSF